MMGVNEEIRFESDVVQTIKNIIARGTSQRELASSFGISPQHLSDIVNSKRGISESVARHLGLERHIVFLPIPLNKLRK